MTSESIEQYADMAIISGWVSELGTASHSYLEIQKMIARETGGISAGLQNNAIYGTDTNRAFFRVQMRCLSGRINEASDLLRLIADETVFTEVEHIRDMISERLLSMKSAFTNNGHQVAMLRASSGNTLQASLAEITGGIESMYHLRRFAERSDADIREYSTRLFRDLRASLPIECHIGGEPSLEPIWQSEGKVQTGNLEIPHTPKQILEAWIADISVSYCALSVPVVRSDHRDAAALMILAQFLRDGYLHSAIREQGGAYGAGARYSAQGESFDFFSYRDPRMRETFAYFETSLMWLLETQHHPLRLEEAKLGVFAQIDRPVALSAEARSDYERSLYGYTDTVRNIQRAALLAVTLDDLKAMVHKYFGDLSRASRVVITSESERENARDL